MPNLVQEISSWWVWFEKYSLIRRSTQIDDDKIKTSQTHVTRHERLQRHWRSGKKCSSPSKETRIPSKLYIWVPHELKDIHLTAQISISSMLMKHKEKYPFFKQMITGYDKQIIYNDVVCKGF